MQNTTQEQIDQRFNIITEVINDFSKMSLADLEKVQMKLNYLCINYDPYENLELSNELENIINEFELNDFLGNPFEFTNIVLQILDKLENEIKTRKN